jgi:site-specific recombinase XerD
VKIHPAAAVEPEPMPTAAELAALRAWHEGLSSRDAAMRYLQMTDGASARGLIGSVRGRLARRARERGRGDLEPLFTGPPARRVESARAVARAIETLQHAAPAQPLIGDDIERWLEPRAVRALQAHGIRTLSALTVRVPRRRRWWASIPGLGVAGARRIEAFFLAHPELTDRARALVTGSSPRIVVPWEDLALPELVDGSQGTFRAPPATCTLNSRNDYEAVKAWLALHEAETTRRAYRKEAERLILWAIVERGKALSSLNTEDATAYRAFLLKPTPRDRWIGPKRPRSSSDWKPFEGPLAPRSVAYALSVLGALFRWLIQQRYVLANPFAGLKVRGANRLTPLASSRYFGEAEWSLVRTVADGLDWSCGWSKPAAQRLRFVLDFAYSTGLRVSELVTANLGMVKTDDQGDCWLHLVGKGAKAGKVALPPLATTSLDRYLVQRVLPSTPSKWDPKTLLVGEVDGNVNQGITAARMWAILKRFFTMAADLVKDHNPALAEKLRRASTHWMRHTHATHALARGADLPTVRDNLRHADLATTSIYLHADEVKRARQLGKAFAAN